jgi:hypothetical protein
MDCPKEENENEDEMEMEKSPTQQRQEDGGSGLDDPLGGRRRRGQIHPSYHNIFIPIFFSFTSFWFWFLLLVGFCRSSGF